MIKFECTVNISENITIFIAILLYFYELQGVNFSENMGTKSCYLLETNWHEPIVGSAFDTKCFFFFFKVEANLLCKKHDWFQVCNDIEPMLNQMIETHNCYRKVYTKIP